MLKTKLFSLVSLGIFFLFAGCDDSYITNQKEKKDIQPQQIEAKANQADAASESEVYKVKLEALNTDAGYRAVKGEANLRIIGDKLTVQVNANGLQPGMVHPQHIHAAGSCPSPAADSNGDGFIDVVEGVPSYGGILIPLDAELTNLSFQTSFPNPENDAGAITYRESASVASLEAETGEDLNLDGRHIVLHGVSSQTNLPESVQSLGGLPAYLTLPVACGEIVKVN